MLRLFLLANFILCSTAEESLSTDSVMNASVAETLAKCKDDNLKMKIECLERTIRIFEDTILKLISEDHKCNSEPIAAENMTLYFKLLSNTQLDMSADLKRQEDNFKNLKALNELLMKYKLSLEDKIEQKSKNETQNQKITRDYDEQNDLCSTRRGDEHLNCLKNCTANDSLPRTCAEATFSSIFKDDVYILKIPNSDLKPFCAFCIYENKNEKSWTIIQRRYDGSQNFYRNWSDYKHGFGNISGEYWLGLERLHIMTKDQPHELWIFLVNKNNKKRFGKYANFAISNENEGYKLTFDNGIGNAGDAFNEHNNLKFATYDRDNKNGCAKYFGSGWWYKDCYHCNLNGVYPALSEREMYDGIKWNTVDMKFIKYVHMAIRAV